MPQAQLSSALHEGTEMIQSIAVLSLDGGKWWMSHFTLHKEPPVQPGRLPKFLEKIKSPVTGI
jgi:hypothetical protein